MGQSDQGLHCMSLIPHFYEILDEKLKAELNKEIIMYSFYNKLTCKAFDADCFHSETNIKEVVRPDKQYYCNDGSLPWHSFSRLLTPYTKVH